MLVLVLHLLEEFVSWVFVTVLLHLGEVTLFWGHSSVNLRKDKDDEKTELESLISDGAHRKSSKEIRILLLLNKIKPDEHFLSLCTFEAECLWLNYAGAPFSHQMALNTLFYGLTFAKGVFGSHRPVSGQI